MPGYSERTPKEPWIHPQKPVNWRGGIYVAEDPEFATDTRRARRNAWLFVHVAVFTWLHVYAFPDVAISWILATAVTLAGGGRMKRARALPETPRGFRSASHARERLTLGLLWGYVGVYCLTGSVLMGVHALRGSGIEPAVFALVVSANVAVLGGRALRDGYLDRREAKQHLAARA